MKKYLFTICLLVWVQILPAQVSGFMGKRGSLSATLQYQANLGYGRYGRSLSVNKISLSYETAIDRKMGIVFQTRFLNEFLSTKQQFGSNSSNIVQVGAEISNYRKRDWTLAPIGKCSRWGIHCNVMSYSIKQDVYGINGASQTVAGTYIFPSISWQHNNRIPIFNKLCFEYGFGLEIPFGIRKHRAGDFGNHIFYNMIFSRLLSAGIAYSL